MRWVRFCLFDFASCACLQAESLEKAKDAMTMLAKGYVSGEVQEEELYQKRDELLKQCKVIPSWLVKFLLANRVL